MLDLAKLLDVVGQAADDGIAPVEAEREEKSKYEVPMSYEHKKALREQKGFTSLQAQEWNDRFTLCL